MLLCYSLSELLKIQATHTKPLTCLAKYIFFYITCHLADTFIQSDLQWIRLSRRYTHWSNVGISALFKGPKAVQILPWPQPCGVQVELQAAPERIKEWIEINSSIN